MKKIIIPDSLTDILEDGKNAFPLETLQLFPFSRSEEVLQLHRKERADLIIIDINSRGTEEDNLCKVIRSDAVLKRVSIIIVYSPDVPEISRYDSCGANMYIEKPVDPRRFLGGVAGLIGIASREALRELVGVSVRVETDDDFFFATSINISTSGMLIQGDKVLIGGSSIRCSFYLDRKVSLEGRIVRVIQQAEDLFHYGIRFTDPDPDTKALIEEFLNK